MNTDALTAAVVAARAELEKAEAAERLAFLAWFRAADEDRSARAGELEAAEAVTVTATARYVEAGDVCKAAADQVMSAAHA